MFDSQTATLYDKNMRLHISRRLDYAVRILTELARHGKGVLVPSKEIARRQHIPFPYLQKIVNQMATAGLVQTYRGKEGGVALRANPATTTLLDIVHALGEMDMNAPVCVVGVDDCPILDACGAHSVWDEIYRMMLQYASQVTLEQIAHKPNLVRTHHETTHGNP